MRIKEIIKDSYSVNKGIRKDAIVIYDDVYNIAKASELALTKRVSAKEAFYMEIVTEVCSVEELEEKTNKIVLKMANGLAVSYKRINL